MGKVKICGFRRVEDIDAANQALPDYIGFVFAPSRRRVDAATAARLKKRLHPKIAAVGVFVNETVDGIRELAQEGIIDLVQLHGDEDDAYMERLKAACGCPIIKAIGIGSQLPPLPKAPDFLLFDTLSPQRGGTGTPFDWSLLAFYRGLPFFLAGGLNAANVRRAMETCSPYAVDASGGLETDGLKDAAKIADFVQRVRGFPTEGCM